MKEYPLGIKYESFWEFDFFKLLNRLLTQGKIDLDYAKTLALNYTEDPQDFKMRIESDENLRNYVVEEFRRFFKRLYGRKPDI